MAEIKQIGKDKAVQDSFGVRTVKKGTPLGENEITLEQAIA